MHEPIRGQTWINAKHGTAYEILSMATNCTNAQNNQRVVIYTGRGEVFVRSLDEFLQKFWLQEVGVPESAKGK